MAHKLSYPWLPRALLRTRTTVVLFSSLGTHRMGEWISVERRGQCEDRSTWNTTDRKWKEKSYSPAWNPECYKWSRECWADDFQCTHNLQVRVKKKIECELERRCSHFSRLSCFYTARLSYILFCVLLPLLKRHFSPWVKFNWNASNRIKDFWSATRLPFQS